MFIFATAGKEALKGDVYDGGTSPPSSPPHPAVVLIKLIL